MRIPIVISLINIVICFIYSNTNETFINFTTENKKKIIISSIVVLILSVYCFENI